MYKYLFILFFFCGSALAESYDKGEISNLYVNDDGVIAVQLKDGFPTAKSKNECSSVASWAEGWAATNKNSPTLKSAVLAAYAAGKAVTLVTSGCDYSNARLRLTAIYVHD